MSVAYRDRVAAFLRARPNEWVSAYTLMEIGGTLAFRTRVSEVRRLHGWRIDNKVVRAPSGLATSYYMFVPATPGQAALPFQGAA